MAILRTDIEKALDELTSQEEGMRFQGLAVVLGKQLWPQLLAHPRKKDFGLDAYAPASLTPEKIGKGLAASITPTLKKVSEDAKTAKRNFPDVRALLFVTPSKVGNSKRRRWEEVIRKDHGIELHLIEREEIITLMMMPENASVRASFLHLDIDSEPQVADRIDRTRRAAAAVTRTWAGKTKGHPLVDLTAVRLDPDGAESADVLSLDQIDQMLSQSGRIVLEGPAGRGKTTTLIQLAQRARAAGTTFMVDLPAWTSSRRGILEYIAGMPAFLAESLTARRPRTRAADGTVSVVVERLERNCGVGFRAGKRRTPGARTRFSERGHHRRNPYAPLDAAVARCIAAAVVVPSARAARSLH